MPDDEVALELERPAVLIVDDHPSNLVALEAVLDRLPVRIVRARSGEEALVRSAACPASTAWKLLGACASVTRHDSRPS
jgi:response regulator RpfG family c-di-GMP phosphodiesterase